MPPKRQQPLKYLYKPGAQHRNKHRVVKDLKSCEMASNMTAQQKASTKADTKSASGQVITPRTQSSPSPSLSPCIKLEQNFELFLGIDLSESE